MGLYHAGTTSCEHRALNQTTALRPQKPLRLIWDGEIGGWEFVYLTPTPYTDTTRMILH